MTLRSNYEPGTSRWATRRAMWLALGLCHVHDHDRAQVVVHGRDAVQDGDDHERDVALVERGAEQVQLADEAGRRRDARKPQHEHRHRHAEPRVLEARAREVLHAHALVGAAA